MAITFQNIVYRSRRRLRLVFSVALAEGAFTPSWYTVTSVDSLGADPTVVGALVLSDSPNVVELALNTDLADGAAYTVTALENLPGADASVLADDTALPLRTPGTATSVRTQVVAAALDGIYGVDLDFDGSDFVEEPSGDLRSVGGEENVAAALERRSIADGLAWDPSYGAKPRQFVDGPMPSAAAFRASLVAEAQSDARVKRATATLTESTDGEARFDVRAQLIGGATISVPVAVKIA